MNNGSNHLQLHKRLSDIRSLIQSAAIVTKDMILPLIDIFHNFSLGVLNSNQQSESLQENISTSLSELSTSVSTLSSSLDEAKDLRRKSQGWTLNAVATRHELFFWSGFPNRDDFEKKVLPRLITLPPNLEKGQRSVAKTVSSGITIQDRAFWIFILMWRDLSIRELYCLVHKSQDYTGSYKSFISLMKNTAKLMGTCARSTIKLPSVESWRTMNTSPFSPNFQYENRLFLILDGTSLRLYNPRNHTYARALWVHYKSHTAYRYFIGCTLSGLIVYISGLYPGVVPDDTLYSEVGLRQLLSETYQSSEEIRFGLMGDKGYVGITPPPDWALLLTQSAQEELVNPTNQTDVPTLTSILEGAPSPRELPSETAALTSTDIAKPRSIVEVSIGKTKRFRRLTSGHIRSVDDPKFLHNLVCIAAYIANLMTTKEVSLKGSDNSLMTLTREGGSEGTSRPFSSTIVRASRGRFSEKSTQTT